MACVQRQTYGNILHVLLDNASTDDTSEVIERFNNQKVPLKVARNTAVLPQTANWNAAMKLVPAHAKYVMLLCADDLIRADAIEKLVARAEEDDQIVLVTALDIVFDRVRAPLPPEKKDIVDGKDFIRAFLSNTYNHFAWQLFFVRWRPEQAEEDYFSDKAATLDTDKLLRVMNTGKVGFVMEPLFYTRFHPGSVSAQYKLSRNPRARLPRWEAAIEYAPKLLSSNLARKIIQREKYFVLRFELDSRRAGAREMADALRKRLSSDGHPTTWWEYIAAVLNYLPYKVRQARIRATANHRWQHPITESDFIEWAPPNAVATGSSQATEKLRKVF